MEKLATPDVTIADLIGDIDPIKAARGGHELSSELTVHYGLLPRANRGIFAINELPDLAGKIQVGLFNIMQEGDVQIKGYPIRLPLDVALVFSANPEDYTARGKIITPLKDRIGSEIRTHYPATVEEGIAITAQEAWTRRNGHTASMHLPNYVQEVIERVAFAAREDKKIDKRSGVSQRLPISAMENVISNAERRAIRNDEKAGRAAHQRRLCRAAGDHRQARTGIRRRDEGRGLRGTRVDSRRHREDLRRVLHRRQRAADRAVVRPGRRDSVIGFGAGDRSAGKVEGDSGTGRQTRPAGRFAERKLPSSRCRRQNSFSKACTRTSASAAAKSASSKPERRSRNPCAKKVSSRTKDRTGREGSLISCQLSARQLSASQN